MTPEKRNEIKKQIEICRIKALKCQRNNKWRQARVWYKELINYINKINY